MNIEEKKCPLCGCWITEDQHIYVVRKTNQVIGCDYCMRDDFADEYWDYTEPDEEEMLYNEADNWHDQYMWERMIGGAK